MQIPLLHQQIMLATERLRDLHRSIMTHTSPVPAAEMEFLLLEIRNLYNIALQLNNENAIHLLNEVQLAMKPPEFSPAIIELNSPGIVESKPAASRSTEEKINPVVNQLPFQQVRMTEANGKYHEVPTHATRFTDHKTLADIINTVETTRKISDKLKTSVRDIKAAIGINEKFQFINHLFNGDALKYNSIIEELNNSSSVVAMKMVNVLSEENSWESHPASAKSFIEIVERRFSA